MRSCASRCAAEIKALHQRLKTTTVYVTHDQIEAMTMADRIVVMHDGIIEQIGTPLELFDRPATCSSRSSSARRR
jgi:multiple sugar transport system ATP-binding protein